jgi:hypothetical protein
MHTALTLDEDDLVAAATEALTRPPSFLYFGELELFSAWGLTITCHRDSDALSRSNYRRLLADLQIQITESGLDPDDYVREISCSHFLVGWMDHLAVRVLREADRGCARTT